MGKPYQDEKWLREQYHDNERSTVEIADECDVADTTICYWMDKYNIQRRNQRESQQPTGKHGNKEWLQDQYIEKRRSMQDIADEVGVSASIILKYLNRYDIERRSPIKHHRRGPCSFITEETSGYECVSAKYNYEKDQCRVHQLVAIAEGANPYKVFSNGRYHIHHENGIRWDNRPSNLTLKSASVHTREHSVDESRHIPDSYDTDKTKEELLSDLRNLVMDWKELDNSAIDMCADELDALLAD